MDTTELRNIYRAEMFDLVEPYFVSDPLIYTYLDDAQKMFCRLTEGIEDGRKFTLAVKAGEQWYSVSKSILKLRSLTDVATGLPVRLVSQEKAQASGIVFNGVPGPLSAFVSGIQKGQLRAWPVPVEDRTIAMDVFRLPARIEEGDTPEIDEQHHLALLHWVKHKVYGIHDSEIFDADKAAMYEDAFRAYCRAARVEQERARHPAGTVSYGGY